MSSVFLPLVQEIYRLNDLEIDDLRYLTPGSNAVFQLGKTVVKIFLPPETKLRDGEEYDTELSALKFADSIGISIPAIICAGTVNDRYTFRYIVMKYIDGVSPHIQFPFINDDGKVEFALGFKAITDKLHCSIDSNSNSIPRFDSPERLGDHMWELLPDTFKRDRKQFLSKEEMSQPVFTHGDININNLLVDKYGRIFLIDFADSVIAPYYYEWPPIVFSLFGCDSVLMKTYFGEIESDGFYRKLITSILIYRFGAWTIKGIADAFEISTDTITDIKSLKHLLETAINTGDLKV